MTSDLKPCPIKPCPFCGSEALPATVDDPRVTCRGPMACCGKQVATPAFAWNRRAPSPAVARLVEACKELYPRAMDGENIAVQLQHIKDAVYEIENGS